MKLEEEVEDIRGWGEGRCKLRVPCRAFQAGRGERAKVLNNLASCWSGIHPSHPSSLEVGKW